DAATRNRRAQARLLLRTELQVVLEDDRLPVEIKVFVGRLLVEQIEQPIDERDEPQPELLVGEIPLAIPVRVRHDVDVEHAGTYPLGIRSAWQTVAQPFKGLLGGR